MGITSEIFNESRVSLTGAEGSARQRDNEFSLNRLAVRRRDCRMAGSREEISRISKIIWRGVDSSMRVRATGKTSQSCGSSSPDKVTMVPCGYGRDVMCMMASGIST